MSISQYSSIAHALGSTPMRSPTADPVDQPIVQHKNVNTNNMTTSQYSSIAHALGPVPIPSPATNPVNQPQATNSFPFSVATAQPASTAYVGHPPDTSFTRADESSSFAPVSGRIPHASVEQYHPPAPAQAYYFPTSMPYGGSFNTVVSSPWPAMGDFQYSMYPKIYTGRKYQIKVTSTAPVTSKRTGRLLALWRWEDFQCSMC
ncbi:hypothetical protein BJ912DRAFT_535342 [Pholiota molesta]|nr:hypothetical protein BJ912DRAFT_535342 [Pholiota molesta]